MKCRILSKGSGKGKSASVRRLRNPRNLCLSLSISRGNAASQSRHYRSQLIKDDSTMTSVVLLIYIIMGSIAQHIRHEYMNTTAELRMRRRGCMTEAEGGGENTGGLLLLHLAIHTASRSPAHTHVRATD